MKPKTVYHCPRCYRPLKRGEPPPWARVVLGPWFSGRLASLRCVEHGPVNPDHLSPADRMARARERRLGIVGGLLLRLLMIAFAALMVYTSLGGDF